MLKKLLATLAVAAVCFGPATVLLSVAVLANPAVAACAPGSLIVGPIPDSLTATTKNGETVTLNRQQLTHAATTAAHTLRGGDGGGSGQGPSLRDSDS